MIGNRRPRRRGSAVFKSTSAFAKGCCGQDGGQGDTASYQNLENIERVTLNAERPGRTGATGWLRGVFGGGGFAFARRWRRIWDRGQGCAIRGGRRRGRRVR